MIIFTRIVNISMAQAQFPLNRRDIAHILKQNEYDILSTVSEIADSLDIEDDLIESVTSYVK